ncbi:MAG: IclR family transcriptional regulator [Anaerolineae bacterium]|nr:IclR family transcriptional regulator [Anaerolineae bacterium]
MNTIIRRSFALLETMATADTSLGITELAAANNLPLSTSHRLLKTLQELGYVEQDPDTHKYTLGVRFLNLRGAVIRQINLAAIAMPIMKALMQRVNETVHLAVMSEGEIVYIERVEGLQTQGMYTRIGKRAPAHSTALGKVMLAYMPEEVRQEVVTKRGLPRFSPTTITTAEELEREVERIRARGYATDNGETGERVRCLAAALRDFTGQTVAALSISAPEERMPAKRDAELSEAVCKAARMISQKLGYIDD